MSVEVWRGHRCPVCNHIAGQEAKNQAAADGWRYIADMVEAALMEKAERRAKLVADFSPWRPPGGAA